MSKQCQHILENTTTLVRVIRCRECKHFRKTQDLTIFLHPHGLVDPEEDGYCNRGAWKCEEEG